MKWDEWRNNVTTGQIVFWTKFLVKRSWVEMHIHKMVAADDAQCFHTHPAWAVRVILWGGYVEELQDGTKRACRPCMIGIVAPTCSHRIDSLINGRVSYSLWLRFWKVANVTLHGEGYPEALRMKYRDAKMNHK